ncbi:MAG: clostripain [Schwartzia sp.]|nr:clostripain [Schwartzia sp. (in: firmicutes)]MBR5163924.1 clostripain [Schwartzia sp. (in: firmicutes)]
MKRKLAKKLASLAVAALFLFTGCGTENNAASHTSQGADFSSVYNASDTWVVYWYLCGTDLESENGAASIDLEELQKVKLPPNVKVVIQTGGANQWHTAGVPARGTGRFVYDADGLHSLGPVPDANMGSGNGLADFLRFGKDNFDADHKVFVFWDHGGGSVGGLCLDERYQTMMSLDEMRGAFSSVYGANPEDPPFELIGFDACLMATVDTLGSIHGFSRYMVASQEIEPGCGWNYTGWVGALAKDPSMGGAKLGKAICDSYMQGCKEYDVDDIATLSLSDVSRAPALLSAYGAYGVEALQAASQNPRQLFSQLSRGAEASENYGGNTREQGYYDMVDMGDLARNTRSAMPATSAPLLSALDDCVLYHVNGSYRPNGLGLSCYHPYDGDADVWRAYAKLDVSPKPIKCLYYYLIFGQMPDSAQEYLSGAPSSVYTPETPSTGAEIPVPATAPAAGSHPIYNVAALEDTPVDVDNQGAAFVQLPASAVDMLSAVHCQLVYMDAKQDILLVLGSDSNIVADWDTGRFKDNFFGTWPMLEGHPVYVEITYDGDGFNLYSIPIKLNGVRCNLQVVYDFKTEKYRILGARKDDKEGVASLVASRELIKLKAGDSITTIHYGMTLSGSDKEPKEVEVDTFTIGANPTVKDEEVGDGTYGYFFEFIDPLNNSALSNMVTYTIRNGQITTSVDNSTTGAAGAQGGFAETGYGADPGLLQTNGGGNSGGIAEQLAGGGNSGGYSGGAPSGGGSIAESLGR